MPKFTWLITRELVFEPRLPGSGARALNNPRVPTDRNYKSLYPYEQFHRKEKPDAQTDRQKEGHMDKEA